MARWPAGLDDVVPRPSSSDFMDTPGVEGDVVIDTIGDEIAALHTYLGINPQGSASTVALRLTNIEANYLLASTKGAANGVAPLGAASLVPVANLGTGAAAGRFLRADGTWADPLAGTAPAAVVVNPSESAYGAAFDGTTDDTDAIQLALNSASAVANSGIPVVVIIPQGRKAVISRRSGQGYALQLGENQILQVDGVLYCAAPAASVGVQYGPNGNAGNIAGGWIVNRTTGGRTAGRTWRCGVRGVGIIDGNAAGQFASTALGNQVLTRVGDGTNVATAFTSSAGGLTGRDNYFVVFRSGANSGRAYPITVLSDTTATLSVPPGAAAPSDSAGVAWDLYGPDVWDGIRFGFADEGFVQGVTIRDVFGWASGPPGETGAVRLYSGADCWADGVRVHSTAYPTVGARGTTAATHNAFTGSGICFSSATMTWVRNCRVWCVDAHAHAVFHGNEHHVVNFQAFGCGSGDLNWEHTSGSITNVILGGAFDAKSSYRSGWYAAETTLSHPDALYGGLILNMQHADGTQTVTITNARIVGQSARAGIALHIGGGTVTSVPSTTAVVCSVTGTATAWAGCTAWILRADNTRLGPLTVQSLSGASVTFTGAHGASVGEAGCSLAVDTVAGISISGGVIAYCQTGITCVSAGTMAKLRAAELTRVDPSVLMVGNGANFGFAGMGYTDRRYATGGEPRAPLTANTTLTGDADLVFADAAGASFTLTLPSPRANSVPQEITVVRLNSGANVVRLACAGSATINGASTYDLSTQYARVRVTLVPSLSGGAGRWIVTGA